jgi:hypothetical protein
MARLETSCPYEAKPIQFDIQLEIPKYKAQLQMMRSRVLTL